MSAEVDLVCYGCGSVHDSARVITLPDGRQVGQQSEVYRAWCEARSALALPDKPTKRWPVTRREYLLLVERARGERAAEQLREVMAGMWRSSR